MTRIRSCILDMDVKLGHEGQLTRGQRIMLFPSLWNKVYERLPVQWSHYEYIGNGKFLPNRQEKKKITLVCKEIAPKELFEYFKMERTHPKEHSTGYK